jgi:hypothetical protein
MLDSKDYVASLATSRDMYGVSLIVGRFIAIPLKLLCFGLMLRISRRPCGRLNFIVMSVILTWIIYKLSKSFI